MSGPPTSGGGAGDRESRTGDDTLFIDLGPGNGRDEPLMDVAPPAVPPPRRTRRLPGGGTRLASVCALALAAVGVFLPMVLSGGPASRGWLEPYPREPHQAWSVAVKSLVSGPGAGTARFDLVPGASGRTPANILPFGNTWVTYVTSDDALPRLIGIDSGTGARRWTYEVGDWGPARVCAGTAVGGALVCVGQAGPVGTDTLVAINLADGLEVARQPVSIDANSVTVVGDDVVLGAYDEATQEFLAQRINVWTGALAWAARVADSAGHTGTNLEAQQGGGPPIPARRASGDSQVTRFPRSRGVLTSLIELPGPGAVIESSVDSHVSLDLSTGAVRSPSTPGTANRRDDGTVMIDTSLANPDTSLTARANGVWWAAPSRVVPVGADREIALPIWTSPGQTVVGGREDSPPIIGVPAVGTPVSAYSSLDGSLLWTASPDRKGSPPNAIFDATVVTAQDVFLLSGPRLCGYSSQLPIGWSCWGSGPRICAVAAADGTALWCSDLSSAAVAAPTGAGETPAAGAQPAVINQVTVVGWDGMRLIVHDAAGLTAMDGKTGATVWSLPATALPAGGLVETVDGRLVATTTAQITVLAPTAR